VGKERSDAVIKVVHCIGGLEVGGAEMMLYKTTTRMNRERVASLVVSTSLVGPIGERIRQAGIPVIAFGKKLGSVDPRVVFKLYQVLKREKPDVLQTYLYEANLYGADLSGTDLSGTDLSGTDLSGANLYGANLSRANLSRANLSRADLSGANLSGANLSGANLYGANLKSIFIYGSMSGLQFIDNNVKIGCEDHSSEYWLIMYETIGKENDYSDKQIEEYYEYIKICKNFREVSK